MEERWVAGGLPTIWNDHVAPTTIGDTLRDQYSSVYNRGMANYERNRYGVETEEDEDEGEKDVEDTWSDCSTNYEGHEMEVEGQRSPDEAMESGQGRVVDALTSEIDLMVIAGEGPDESSISEGNGNQMEIDVGSEGQSLGSLQAMMD